MSNPYFPQNEIKREDITFTNIDDSEKDHIILWDRVYDTETGGHIYWMNEYILATNLDYRGYESTQTTHEANTFVLTQTLSYPEYLHDKIVSINNNYDFSLYFNEYHNDRFIELVLDLYGEFESESERLYYWSIDDEQINEFHNRVLDEIDPDYDDQFDDFDDEIDIDYIEELSEKINKYKSRLNERSTTNQTIGKKISNWWQKTTKDYYRDELTNILRQNDEHVKELNEAYQNTKALKDSVQKLRDNYYNRIQNNPFNDDDYYGEK